MEPGRSRRGELDNSEDGEIHPGQRMSWARGITVAWAALELWGIGLSCVFTGRIKTKMWKISPWGWCWLFREHRNEPHGGGCLEGSPMSLYLWRFLEWGWTSIWLDSTSMWRMYIALRKGPEWPCTILRVQFFAYLISSYLLVGKLFCICWIHQFSKKLDFTMCTSSECVLS